MQIASAKQKGKSLENYVAQLIQEFGLGKAIRTPGSGSGLNKGDIFANIPFLIECKNQKTICIPKWIDQAKKQAVQGNYDSDKWALIFKRHNTANETYTVISTEEFLKLLKKNSEPLIKKPDRQLNWDLRNLKINCQKVLKQLK